MMRASYGALDNRYVALLGSGMLHKPLGLLAELTHRCPLGCPYCSNPLALDTRETITHPKGRSAKLPVGLVGDCATTRYSQDQRDTQRICADVPSASVCQR
jgi:hypothetical protein